jgi:hypothetical protein
LSMPARARALCTAGAGMPEVAREEPSPRQGARKRGGPQGRFPLDGIGCLQIVEFDDRATANCVVLIVTVPARATPARDWRTCASCCYLLLAMRPPARRDCAPALLAVISLPTRDCDSEARLRSTLLAVIPFIREPLRRGAAARLGQAGPTWACHPGRPSSRPASCCYPLLRARGVGASSQPFVAGEER